MFHNLTMKSFHQKNSSLWLVMSLSPKNSHQTNTVVMFKIFLPKNSHQTNTVVMFKIFLLHRHILTEDTWMCRCLWYILMKTYQQQQQQRHKMKTNQASSSISTREKRHVASIVENSSNIRAT